MTSVNKTTIHLRIVGRVQGVAYRYGMTHEARRLGLSGWVRNRSDGSVEAVACGAEEAVEALVRWAWQGPPAARVERVEQAPWHGTLPSDGFEQTADI